MVPSVPSDLDGSEGEDRIIARHPLTGTDYSGYFINLETGKVHYRSVDGALTLVSKLENIEHAQGHQQTQDHLTGNHENNQLDGRGGKDTLWGKDGDDTLILAQGEAHGGRGKDHYIILENSENHPVDISIHDTKGEESNITFFPFRYISCSLIKDQATNDRYDMEIVLYPYRNSHVFIKDAYHAKNQNTLERNGHYSFYTTEGLLLSTDWPETITIDENGQFAFTPQFYATYDPLKDEKHKTYFDNTPKDEISISFEKGEVTDLITVGKYSPVSIPANIQLKLVDTCFNDRLTGNLQDNMITSSRGNDYLEGSAGRDIYYIEQPENVGRTVLINNLDILVNPQNDLLVLPMPLSQISDIQVIGNDIILSPGHEPYKNLQIRIKNFLLSESYRHLDILSKKDVDEKGLDNLAHTKNTLYTAKLVINQKFTGNDQNNVITSSRGNDILAGKGGRDIYYIEPFADPRTISIDNQDTSANPQDDLLFLPVPFIQISQIQVIGKDVILSSKNEPDKNLKIRIRNFSEESYRHLKILDNTGHLFELNVDREGQPYLDHVAGNLHPTEKADNLIINNGDILPEKRLEAQGGDDVIIDNSYSDYSLHGGKGDDIIIALENGNKKLYGGKGNDQLFSGAGDDTLSGGEGDDLLSGGEGLDAYCVSRFDGHTTIEDSDQKYNLSLTDIDRKELLFTVVSEDIYITLKDPHFKDIFSIKLTKGVSFSKRAINIMGKNHDVGCILLNYLMRDRISSFNAEEKQQLVNGHKAPVLVENTVQLVAGY